MVSVASQQLLFRSFSTHADRQGVDISVTVCLFVCVCICTVTDYSAEDTAIAASNFARRFIGVQGRESHILGNVAPPEAQNRPAHRPVRALNYK